MKPLYPAAVCAAIMICLPGCTPAKPDTLVVAAPNGYASKCKSSISWALNRLGMDVEIEMVELPFQSMSSGDENDQEQKQMRTQLMAGEGPDLLLLDQDQQLFQDIIKTAQGGAFYDLAPLLDETIAETDCVPAVMDAGIVDGKRYFVPLGFDVTGVAARTDWLNGWRPDAKTPVEFVTQLSEHAGRDLTLWEEFLTDACPQPLLDTANKTLNLTPQMEEIALYYRDAIDFPHMQKYQDEFWESPVAQTLEENVWAVTHNTELDFLPVPNGQDGYTAKVSLMAAVRANSPYAEEAAKIIGQMLQPDQANAVTRYVPPQCSYCMIPVGREARDLFFETDSRGQPRTEETKERLNFMVDHINAAQIENRANWMANNQFRAWVGAGKTPEEAFSSLQKKYSRYFEE